MQAPSGPGKRSFADGAMPAAFRLLICAALYQGNNVASSSTGTWMLGPEHSQPQISYLLKRVPRYTGPLQSSMVISASNRSETMVKNAFSNTFSGNDRDRFM